MNGRLVASIICVLLSVGNGAAADPLHDAAKAGDVMQIKLLLSRGADINGGSGLAPPLFYAIQNRHEQAALALIKLGADVKATSIWGTPLHAAAAANMPMAAAWLIGYGADPNARWNQLTPLHIAARDGRLDFVRILIDRGADTNALTLFEEPALHLALLHGHGDVGDLLQTRGDDPPEVEDIDDLLPAGDPKRGKRLALPCEKCHTTNQLWNTVCEGGTLWNIVDRPKATGEGRFSPALKAVGGTWTYDDLNAFLAQPAWTVPGTTMKMQGIHDPRDRADLIAFLRTLSDNPSPLP
jgi:cytochrome c